MKKIISIQDAGSQDDSVSFWKTKTPEERVEALETIREHYYSMLGYTEPPRIKKIIKIT